MHYKKIVIISIVLLVLIQFIRIDRTTPPTDSSNDYMNLSNATTEISNIIKNSCYDCHSYETNYPWYSNVAPISWMLKSHINEGREHLNFSDWGNYSSEIKIALQKECAHELEENQMPLKSYTIIHSKAKLSNENKELLIKWLNRKTDLSN
jgi:hypothetical protein